MYWQYIVDLFKGVFFSFNSITTWLGIVSFILLLLPTWEWEGKVKAALETTKPYRIYFLFGFVFVSVILTSYSMYVSKQKQINQLQNKIAGQNAKTDTKQDIRTFLESVHPIILQMVDERQKKIHVLVSIPKQIKLLDLPKYSDFDNFLSFEKSGARCIGNTPEKGLIKELGCNSYMDGYYLYPKDGLIK